MDIEMPFSPFAGASTKTDVSGKKEVVHVGVVSRYPPAVIYQGYQPIMDYLTQNSEYTFELRLSSSYHETVQQLVRGEVTAAFLGSVVYARERKNAGLQCILKPLGEDGEAWSHTVLVALTESPIQNLADLRGKKVALPSQDSYSGIWLPSFLLPEHGIRDQELASLHHFLHHQTVVFQVLKGNYDAGVVKESIAEEFLPRGLRILFRSQPIPTSPLVTTKKCDPNIVRSIQEALLRIDVRLPDHKEMVARWDKDLANGFTVATDRDYDALATLLNNARVR